MFVIAFALLANLALVTSFSFHGATAPLGVFDPLQFQSKNSPEQLARFREAELKHGRWGMISALSIPLIESKTHLPAIHEFDHLSDNTQIIVVSLILMGEFGTMLKGWKDPFKNGTDNYFKLKPEYQPGDLGFETSNPDDVDMANKELNNGRLAMIASLGMIAQELVTNKPLFVESIF